MKVYKLATVLLITIVVSESPCSALIHGTLVASWNPRHIVGSSSDMKRLAAIAASISEQDRMDNNNDFHQALSSSVRYLETLSRSASEIINDNMSDLDDEFSSATVAKEPSFPRVLLDLNSQRRSYRFDINIPTGSIGVSSTTIGLAVRRITENGALSVSALDFDTLSFINVEDERLRSINPSNGVAPFHKVDVSEVNTVQFLSDSQWKDTDVGGLIVSSVDRRGLAWDAGVRAGDYLVATSATIGDKMWPKSTLEGVRSAISSRKLLSSSVQIQFERPAQFSDGNVVEEFELSLTRPIGITIENEINGKVRISGFSDQASDELKTCLCVGDSVIAVESSLGGNMWPVSNVEGVISACTSRLPGLPIKLRFERKIIAPSIKNDDSSSETQITRAASVKSIFNGESSRFITVPSSTVNTNAQKTLLKKVRDLLRRYRTVHDPLEEKSSEVLLLVAERAVRTLSSASMTLDAKTLLLLMDSFTLCNLPSRAIQLFEAAVGLSSDGSKVKVTDDSEKQQGSGKIVSESSCLNLYTGTALLRAHAVSGSYHAARRVLASMEGDLRDVNGIHSVVWPGNIKTDSNAYNTVIFAAVNSGNPEALDMAKQLYTSMSEPVLFPTARPKKTLVTYNTLISAYARSGNRQEAFAVFKNMKDAGINPDRVSITSLIKAAVEDGDLRLGKALLKDMKKAGIDADVVTYNTLIKAYCDRGQLFDAKEMVNEMETRGIQPDAKTYGLLMNALLKNRKPGPCLTLFESACSDQRTVAITENVYLYTTAITAAASLGDYDRALDLITRMTFAGVKPNMKTLTALMSASLSAGKFDYALEVYKKISNPDGMAMSLALRGFCDRGDFDHVLSLLRSQRPNQHVMTGRQIMSSFDYVLRKSLEASDFKTALNAMNDLLAAGFVPSIQTFKSILSGINLEQPRRNIGVSRIVSDEMSKFEFLLAVLDALQRRKLSLDTETYIAIIKEGARAGGIRRKIASLLAKSRSKSVPVGKQISDELPNDQRGDLLITWVDLFKNFSFYKEKLDATNLPPIRIRCNDQALRRVLLVEQSLSLRTRI